MPLGFARTNYPLPLSQSYRANRKLLRQGRSTILEMRDRGSLRKACFWHPQFSTNQPTDSESVSFHVLHGPLGTFGGALELAALSESANSGPASYPAVRQSLRTPLDRILRNFPACLDSRHRSGQLSHLVYTLNLEFPTSLAYRSRHLQTTGPLHLEVESDNHAQSCDTTQAQ